MTYVIIVMAFHLMKHKTRAVVSAGHMPPTLPPPKQCSQPVQYS